jgi:hypothetical protein
MGHNEPMLIRYFTFTKYWCIFRAWRTGNSNTEWWLNFCYVIWERKLNRDCAGIMNFSSLKLNMPSVCMTKLKYSIMELTIKEHVQPLCTRRLAYYTHATWVGYAANLKMPTKSWMAADLEVAGFYLVPRSRRRKVRQSTKSSLSHYKNTNRQHCN